MNIILPIAGSRSTDDSDYIKSLQEIERKTVIQHSIDALSDVAAEHFIVIIKREDINTYHLDSIVKLLRPDVEIVIAEGETIGAACTCMLAVDNVDMDKPLLITGSDELRTVSTQKIIEDFQQRELDGGVAIFDDIHPRWSYVKVDENDFVVEAAEKRPISRNAVAGLYYFKRSGDFFAAAQKLILKNANVGGKFYVCPVYNELILQGKKLGVYRIKKEQYYKLSHDSGMEAYRNYLKMEAVR